MGPRTPAFGLVVAALAAAACGGGGVSAELAGTSQHFRLFVGSTLAGTLAPGDELARLETNWADTETLLRMPDGQIDYVLLPSEQIAAACESRRRPAARFTGRSTRPRRSINTS